MLHHRHGLPAGGFDQRAGAAGAAGAVDDAGAPFASTPAIARAAGVALASVSTGKISCPVVTGSPYAAADIRVLPTTRARRRFGSRVVASCTRRRASSLIIKASRLCPC